MAQSTYTGSSDKMSDLASKASDQIGKVTDQVEDVAKLAAEKGRKATEGVQEVAGNIKGAVDQSVKDQPMATLAVMAAIGFVLGALWKA